MKKHKILLCKIDAEDAALTPERYDLSQSYAFEYLTAFARQNELIAGRFDIRILEFKPGEMDEDIVFRVALEKPFLAGFSCSVKNYSRCADVARQVKLASPKTNIVFGGPEMLDANRILNVHPFIDFAAVGEGEETFSELLLALAENSSLADIRGLVYRSGEEIANNPPRENLEPQKIPSIFNKNRVKRLSGIALYESSRGCRHKCSYCLWSPTEKRYFPMDRVKTELGLLLENKNITRIWFIDSDFDSDPERAKEIIRFVRDNRHNGLELSAFLNFNCRDEELVELVSDTFFEVPVGLQTVNRKILKALGRSWFDLESFEENIAFAMRRLAPEKIYIDLMYGLPEERFEHFIESLLWCLSRGLTHINFFRLAIFPGTALERLCEKYGYVRDVEPPHLVYASDSFSYEDLMRIETVAINCKVLLEVVGREAMIGLAQNADLTGILLNLHKCAPDFDSCYTAVNESNIMGVDVGRLKRRVLEYLKQVAAGDFGKDAAKQSSSGA